MFSVIFLCAGFLAPVHAGPREAALWISEGNRFLQQKRYEEAKAAFLRATQEDPESGPAWHGLGNAHYHLGEKEEALGAYDRSLELDPNNPGLASFVQRIQARSAAPTSAVSASTAGPASQAAPQPASGRRRLDSPAQKTAQAGSGRTLGRERTSGGSGRVGSEKRWSVGLGLGLGIAGYSARDFKESGEALTLRANADPDETATVKNLPVSAMVFPEIQGFYRVTPARAKVPVDIGLGIGFQWFGRATYEETLTRISNNRKDTNRIKTKTASVPVSAYVRMPYSLGKSRNAPQVDFTLGGGVDFYTHSVDFDFTRTEPGRTDNFRRGNMKPQSGKVGGHVLVGIEYRPRPYLSFGVTLGGGFVTFKDLQGVLTDENGTTENRRLIMEKNTDSGDPDFNRERLGTRDVNSGLSSNQRILNLNLSGFRGAFSVRYHF